MSAWNSSHETNGFRIKWLESTHAKLLASDENRMVYLFLILRNVTTSQISTTYILFMLYILILPSETRWKKVTNSANFSWSLRYCVTRVSSFLSYSTSDFQRSPSVNITSGSPISDMDGHSSNSLKILKYSSLAVVILLHYKWLFWGVFCGRAYLISYAQGILAGSPHTGPSTLHSSDPLQWESTGDQWFHRPQGQWSNQLRNYKLHKSNIIWVSWVFDSLASPLFVQQLVWTNMEEDIKTSRLLWGGSTVPAIQK